MAPPLLEDQPLKHLVPIRLKPSTFQWLLKEAKRKNLAHTVLARELICQGKARQDEFFYAFLYLRSSHSKNSSNK
jgi:hypothetical protein